MRPYSLRALTLVALLTVAACSEAATVPEPIVWNEPLPYDPGPDVGGLTLQREIFSDGKVTFDEYERAFTAGVECMRAEGFEVEGPLRYPEAPLAIAPGTDPRHRLGLIARNIAAEEDERWSDVNQRCQVQWYYMVEQIYLRQFVPTEEETRAWLERAWACAEAKGVDLSDPPTEDEAVMAVGLGCRPWESDQ